LWAAVLINADAEREHVAGEHDVQRACST
jgi:hypothetical protein